MIFDGPIDEAVEFVKPRGEDNENHHPIVGAIYDLYRRDPGRWGRPLAPQREISENGGGFVQEFDKGMITSSVALESRLGAENATVGLGKGVFLAAYRKAGGPAGPWGFMIGAPTGIIENYELRTMEFQNGTAGFAIEGGMRFDPGALKSCRSGRRRLRTFRRDTSLRLGDGAQPPRRQRGRTDRDHRAEQDRRPLAGGEDPERLAHRDRGDRYAELRGRHDGRRPRLPQQHRDAVDEERAEAEHDPEEDRLRVRHEVAQIDGCAQPDEEDRGEQPLREGEQLLAEPFGLARGRE
ncbi:hypothetical protein CRE_15155, partial [Caenorhabditis remanei]